ncbi:MAG: methyltransferase domain-containing protein [Candidatus Woesebacteria bacterium]
MSTFQDPSFLVDLYTNDHQIISRGQFLKRYSNRKFSIRDLLLDQLGEPKKKSIIDVGAGNCSFIRQLMDAYPDNHYAALDIVKHNSCLECKELDYRIYSDNIWPEYVAKFDIAILMHMLYHINNHKLFFKGLKQNLNKKHVIFITTKSKATFPEMERIFKEISYRLFNFQTTGKSISSTRDEEHFCYENGETILRKSFPEGEYSIDSYLMETQVFVESPKNVLDYVLSTPRYNLSGVLSSDKNEEYKLAWLKEISRKKMFIDKYIEVLYVIKN